MVKLKPLDLDIRSAARFTMRVCTSCPHCGVVGEQFEAIAIGNPWLDSNLRLAHLCEDCGGWSMVGGDCRLRRPDEFEGRELLRDYRASLAWTEWKLRQPAGVS